MGDRNYPCGLDQRGADKRCLASILPPLPGDPHADTARIVLALSRSEERAVAAGNAPVTPATVGKLAIEKAEHRYSLGWRLPMCSQAIRKNQNRIIEFVVDERARGSFNSDSFGGRLEAGWRQSFGRHYVTPFVGMDAYELDIDGFTENSLRLGGAPSILGLTYQADTVTSVTSSVGLQFDTHYALANDRMLTPFVRVAWVHEYNPERGVQSFLTGAPAAAFLVDGASAAEDVARVQTGLRLDLSERIALWGFFEGDFSDRTQSYAGVGGGDVAFAGSGNGQAYAGRVGMKVAW